MAIDPLQQVHFSLFQYNAENSTLRIKLALAERMKTEYAAIRDKYDGSKPAQLEADLSRVVDQKADVGGYLNRVQTAIKKFDDLRNKLIEMRNAADLGSAEAFDYAFSTLATMTGSAILDRSSLLSNNRTSSGTWPETTETVAAAGIEANVTHYFLGSDYAIELNDGSGMARPDLATNKLTGGSVNANLADLTNASIVGDTITFTDSASGNTYTGTLHRGGGGILNAWAYGNLATQTDIDNAKADIDAAIERIATAERSWNMAEAQLTAAFKSLGVRQDEAMKTYQDAANEELDAKNAELKAAKARFELVTNTLALTSAQNTNFIYQMFMTTPVYEKPGLFDILGGA